MGNFKPNFSYEEVFTCLLEIHLGRNYVYPKDSKDYYSKCYKYKCEDGVIKITSGSMIMMKKKYDNLYSIFKNTCVGRVPMVFATIWNLDV